MSCSPSSFEGSRYWVSGYPELVAEWHPERNGTLTPYSVSAGSGRLIWWRCSRSDEHVWRAKPNNRTMGSGCPFCANRKVSSTNNLAVCFPFIASEWHPERNGRTAPDDVVATSSRVCWWRCSVRPEHEWRASVRDRTRDQTACPYCCHKRVSHENSLASCHPALAAQWHPTRNDDLMPDGVTSGSGRAAWWQCAADPAHAWRATIANRALRASGCPHCARTRLQTAPGSQREPRDSP
jgi:DNA-directed RNA polymerase subunit RPC12/RpoP